MKETLLHSETGSRPTKTKQFIAALRIPLVTFDRNLARMLSGQARDHCCCPSSISSDGSFPGSEPRRLSCLEGCSGRNTCGPTLAIKKHLLGCKSCQISAFLERDLAVWRGGSPGLHHIPSGLIYSLRKVETAFLPPRANWVCKAIQRAARLLL